MSNEQVSMPKILATATAMPKYVVVGEKVSTKPIPELQIILGKTHVIAFLGEGAIPKNLHWIKKPDPSSPNGEKHLGFVECTGGACCRLMKAAPQLMYFFLCVEYPVVGYDERNRAKITLDGIKICYHKVRDIAYNTKICSSLLENMRFINEKDIKVEDVRGKKKYQDLQYTARESALYKTHPEIMAQLDDLNNYFITYIDSIADIKVMSDHEITAWWNDQDVSSGGYGNFEQKEITTHFAANTMVNSLPAGTQQITDLSSIVRS